MKSFSQNTFSSDVKFFPLQMRLKFTFFIYVITFTCAQTGAYGFRGLQIEFGWTLRCVGLERSFSAEQKSSINAKNCVFQGQAISGKLFPVAVLQPT